MTAAAAVILGLTTFGRSTYSVGANETAARFSGIGVDRTKLLIYTGSGLMAGLTGRPNPCCAPPHDTGARVAAGQFEPACSRGAFPP